MEILQKGRIKIAYEASGSGEAGVVILIRGQGTQLIHWPESFYEAFSNQGFLTIRFDNRDTGLSSKFDSIAGQELEALKRRLAAGEDIDPPNTMDDYDTPNNRPLSPNCVANSHRTNLYVGCHVLFVSRSAFRVGT